MKVSGFIAYLLLVLVLCLPATARAVPAVPAVTGALSVTQSSFNATWSPVNGAVGYQLDVSTTPLFSSFAIGFNSLDVSNVTSYPVTGLNSGLTYYYRVRAYDGSGTGQSSTISALITLPATPIVPTVAAASAITQSGFTASWTAVTGAAGYRIDVATDTGFAALVGGYADQNVGNVTSIPISGLAAGTPYYYRIRAYNNGGTSLDSISTAVVTLLAIPAVPTVNGAVSITQSSFTATWSAVPAATGYRLDVSTNSGFTSFVTGYNNRDVANVSSFNVSGLTTGSTCFYRVRAYNSGGTSINSVTGALLTQPFIATAPAALSATSVSQTGFSAGWGAVNGAATYQLDVATDALFTSFVQGYAGLDVALGTSYSVTGLNPGVAYFYRVRAYDAGGVATTSNVVAVVTLPAIPGVPVVSTTPVLSQGGFTAAWSAISGALGYQLDVATDAGFSSLVTGYNNRDVGVVTSFAVTNLLPATTYYYRVRAYNNGGISVDSSPGILITLPLLPGIPAAPRAVSVTQAGFSATWGVAGAASSYLLDVSTSPSFSAFLTGFNNLNVANVSSYPVGSLAAGTTYYFRVRSSNAGGTSVSSVTAALVTLPPFPTAPVAASAASITQTGFLAQWNPVSGAGGYLLDVSTDKLFNGFVPGYSNLDVQISLSSPVAGLTPGTTYYYRLRAYNNSGSGANSNVISLTTVPNIPVATAATAVSQSSFTANWGTVAGVKGYYLDVASNAAFTTILKTLDVTNTAATTAPVTGLTPGLTYYFRVRAYTSGGASDYSNSISLTTLGTPVALPATNITQASFTANWLSAAGALDYWLDVSTSQTFASFVIKDQNVVNATSFDVTGLTLATTYYYRVRSRNSTTTSLNSNTVTQSTLATPTATAATAVSQTGFTATWTTTGGAGGYRLDVASDSAFSAILTAYNNLDVGTVTSFPVSGLTAGVTYYYRVRAYTSSATSGNSNIISQMTLATPVATAATTITQTSFKATWGSVSGATGYALDVATDAAFTNVLPAYADKKITAALLADVSGLTAGTVYFYRVRSYNTTATSINSNTIVLTTTPPAPVASSGTVVTQTGFTANWSPAQLATGYRLDLATNSTFTVLVTGYNNLDVANVTSYPIVGLTVGATYYYRIRAVNSGGTSGNSNAITQATLTIPTATAATFVTQTSFNATWSTAGGATGYLLDVSADTLFNTMVPGYQGLDVGNVTSTTVSGLTPGVTYYYRVRAYTSVATTGNSNVITQITLATPVATEAAVVTLNSFKATWMAVVGATGYYLDVAIDPTFTSMLSAYQNKNVMNVTNYAVSGLATGVSYYYRVRAYNGTATTVNSNVINPTTFPAVPVASAASSITQTSFIANWVPAAGSTGYRLDVATNSAFATFVDGYNDLDVKNVFSQAVSGLTAGNTYYYRIRAYNAGGTSVSSASITQVTVPPAPVATTATTVTQSGFKATWSATNGANSYLLDVALDAGFTNIVSGYSNLSVANATTSFTVSGLLSGTDYFYRVRAVNSAGIGDYSNVIFQATLATPVATSATLVFQTGFTATWGAVNGATTYKLDVGTNSSFSAFVTGYKDKDVGLATSAVVSGLTSGTVYYYRVRAVKDGATSVNSNTVSQATLAIPIATAATAITQTGFSATWNSAQAATSYLLDVATDSGFTTALAGFTSLDVGAVNSYTVAGLSPGTAYYYRLRAVGSGGISTNSATITLTTLPATPAPPAPASATAVTQYTFTANWNPVSGATGYRLDVATDTGFTVFVSGYFNRDMGNATSAALSNLAAGTTYYYRVRAYNTGGISASSVSVSQTTLPPTPPATPVPAAASLVASSGFTANWSSVIGATGYVLDVAGDAAFSSILAAYSNSDVGNVTSFAVSGLASGTVYYYRVRAYNAAGTSTLSSGMAVTTRPASTQALPAGTITMVSFSASWDAVSGASGYQIDVSTDAAFTSFVNAYNNRDVGSVTSYPVSGLVAGTAYYYRVRAYNVGGVGTASNVIGLVTLPLAPLALPAVSVTRNDFSAVWAAVSGAGGYLIDVASDAAFTGFVSGYAGRDTGNVTTLAVSGLTAGTTYYYRVRAYTSGGIGANSNTIFQATLPPVPPAPVALAAASVTPTGFTAAWGAIYGAPGYRIDVSSAADFSNFVVGYNNFDVGNTSTCDVIGLTPGTTYYFRVRAYNGGGSSDSSNTISVESLSALLTVTIIGAGGGSVHSSAGNIACASGSPAACSAAYDGGVSVTLSATADSSSIFAGWTGACSGFAGCVVVMDSTRAVTATFNILQPVRIADPVSPRYFDTLQAAYDGAVDGDVIEMLDGVLVGNLVADRAVTIRITGGFNSTYTANSLDTILQGTVTVQQGTVRMEKVKVGL